MEQIIKISKDYSDIPGPRYISEGPFSGEDFRNTILFPKLKECIEKGTKLIIDLDGTQGYGTSFLEEAFGGLIRENKLPYDSIINTIKIISTEETYLEDDIMCYLEDAKTKDEEN